MGLSRSRTGVAAEANSAEAQYQLGLMTADGVGGPQDDVAARALFEKAAAQDHPGALERMGAFAQSGRGGPQDASAAKAYYEKAAALGHAEAHVVPGALVARTRVAEPDDELQSFFSSLAAAFSSFFLCFSSPRARAALCRSARSLP